MSSVCCTLSACGTSFPYQRVSGCPFSPRAMMAAGPVRGRACSVCGGLLLVAVHRKPCTNAWLWERQCSVSHVTPTVAVLNNHVHTPDTYHPWHDLCFGPSESSGTMTPPPPLCGAPGNSHPILLHGAVPVLRTRRGKLLHSCPAAAVAMVMFADQ